MQIKYQCQLHIRSKLRRILLIMLYIPYILPNTLLLPSITYQYNEICRWSLYIKI